MYQTNKDTMNIYQEVRKFINQFTPGETFTTQQFHAHMAKLGYRDTYQPHYRINTYRTYMKSAGFLANPKQGLWMVICNIPDWVTLSELEIARRYKGNHAAQEAVRKMIADFIAKNKWTKTESNLCFNIGDQFKASHDRTTYTIEEHPTRKDDVRVTWIEGPRGKKGYVGYTKQQVHELISDGTWTLITPKAVEPKYSFNIGDRFTIIGDSDTYTIVKHESDSNYVRVTWPDLKGNGPLYTKEQAQRNFTDGTWTIKPKKAEPKPKAPAQCKFKVGDKVRLMAGEISHDTHRGWIQSDKVKRGTTYTVDATMPEKADGGDCIKLKPENGAKGQYWLKAKYFVSANLTHNELNTFKVGDKVRFIASKTIGSFYREAKYYTQQAGLKTTEVYTVSQANAVNDSNPETGKAYIRLYKLEGRDYCHPYDCFELVKEEPKPRMMLCTDMTDSSAHYTVGKIYELEKEDNNYYFFKSNDDGPCGGGGMYKHRFVEVKDEPIAKAAEPAKRKMFCVDNKGMSAHLILNKEYEIVEENAHHIGVISEKGIKQFFVKDRFSSTPKQTTSPSPALTTTNPCGEQSLPPFKAGDKVTYTGKKSEWWPRSSDKWEKKNGMVVGNTYTVSHCSKSSYKGNKGFSASLKETTYIIAADCLELAKQQTVTKMECIDNSWFGAPSRFLTKGKIYDVIDKGMMIGQDKFVTVVNDRGEETDVWATRFAIPKPQPTMLYCIDNKGYEEHLTVGKQYKIHGPDKGVDGELYWNVTNDQDYAGGYLQRRFAETMPEPRQPRRTMVCTDNTDYESCITVGKEYEIFSETAAIGNMYYEIINDKGTRGSYRACRFSDTATYKVKGLMDQLQAAVPSVSRAESFRAELEALVKKYR